MKYTILDIAEEISQESYNIGRFVCKFFYQVSSLQSLNKSMDEYMVSRFSQRLEYFVHEHNKISEKEKKDFYAVNLLNVTIKNTSKRGVFYFWHVI